MKTINSLYILFLMIGFFSISSAFSAPFKLTANDGREFDYFGRSCSISGDYAIIGSSLDTNDSSRGSAYIFKRLGQSWVQVQKLMSGGNLGPFGRSVSISGDYAIIGAWGDDDIDVFSGAAYIFQRIGSSWVQVKKLTASDGGKDDHFGYSVSISGDHAIVGAYNNNDDTPSGYGGSVYFFKQIGNSWAQTDKISANDWGLTSRIFGVSVSISSDYAIVGDGGHFAYICKRIGDSWTPVETLSTSGYSPHDYYGVSVSIFGDYALVGAYVPYDNDSTDAAYLFKRNGESWEEVEQLVSSDSNKSAQFGYSVSVSGEHAIVGAYGVGANNTSIPGAAYVSNLRDITNPPPPNSMGIPWFPLLLKK